MTDQPTHTHPAPILLQGLRQDTRGVLWTYRGGLWKSNLDGDERSLKELETGPYGPTRQVFVQTQSPADPPYWQLDAQALVGDAAKDGSST